MFVPTVLLVDDKPQNLDVLVEYLGDSGIQLTVATSGEDALAVVSEQAPDLILLDVMMPGLNGFEVCQRLKANASTTHIPVIFMSALSDTDSKLQGFTAGGIDFITKPLQRDETLARINAHLTISRQQQELRESYAQLEVLNEELAAQVARREAAEQAKSLADETLSALTQQEAERWGLDAFVGQSRAIRSLLDEVRSLQSAAQTNVLVLGESGTGKELVSRAIHYGSQRRAKPFIAVNCSAIPNELADAEFFGHTKGAYTGAVNERSGYFERADGGTLFLDEIGDMPLTLQAKLLRVLEDGVVTPIGGRKSRQVNVRVVAATNADIRAKVQEKQFRQDLFFRLAGYQLALPPLRMRAGDVALLAEHFISVLSQQMGRERIDITTAAKHALGRYHFPGNVRELKNMIEYALISSRGMPIDVHHLHFLEPTIQSATAIHSAADLPQKNVIENDLDIPELSSPIQRSGRDEEQVMAYVEQHGRIDNTSAQALLNVDHARASYLLKKLFKEGRLKKQGERRWTYYTL